MSSQTRRQGGALTEDQAVVLAGQPSASAAAAIRRAHVKTVSIGLPVVEAEATQK